MKALPALLLALVALLAAGCGDDDSDTAPTYDDDSALEQPESTGTTDAQSDGDCRPAQQPPRKSVELPKPTKRLSAGKKQVATVKTSCGTFTIKLDLKRAPKTTSSFSYLARKRVFDNTFFHRIVADFVIQGGDPIGNGTGDAGYKIVERPPSNLIYDEGVVAMAKGRDEAPGTFGSQFFVVTGGQGEALPAEYALLGKVEDGIDVVEKIGRFANPDQSPSQIVIIKSIRVK